MYPRVFNIWPCLFTCNLKFLCRNWIISNMPTLSQSVEVTYFYIKTKGENLVSTRKFSCRKQILKIQANKLPPKNVIFCWILHERQSDIFENFSMFPRKAWCHHSYFKNCLFNSHLVKSFIMAPLSHKVSGSWFHLELPNYHLVLQHTTA